MPRKPGIPNKARRIEHAPLRHQSHVWFYDGRLYPGVHDDQSTGEKGGLHITKIHGRIDSRCLAELDEAIKTECRRLGVGIVLDDRKAADLLLFGIAIAT